MKTTIKIQPLPPPPIEYDIVYEDKYCGELSETKAHILQWCEFSSNDICQIFSEPLKWTSINSFIINLRCKQCKKATKKLKG